tara:strand:+ start:7404 stop:7724 length:321 start_codon:yes stop_codon:yes gene_type:complete
MAGDFPVPGRIRLDENQFAGFGLDEYSVTDEQDLAVAVSSALPLPLARGRVEAGEDAVVEAVDETLVDDGIRELELHSGCFPEDGPLPAPACVGNPEERTADPVAG